MAETYYVYNNDTSEVLTYDDIESFLEDIINEDYLEELYNEYWNPIDLPIIGTIGMGTLLKQLDRIMEAFDDEVTFEAEEINYSLGVEEICYFNNYIITTSPDILKEIKGE